MYLTAIQKWSALLPLQVAERGEANDVPVGLHRDLYTLSRNDTARSSVIGHGVDSVSTSLDRETHALMRFGSLDAAADGALTGELMKTTWSQVE